MKLFKVFKWQNSEEGQIQTYLMAENIQDAVLQFGEIEGIKVSLHGYGIKETTISDLDSEIQDLYIEYNKIRTAHDNLVEIYEKLEGKRLDKNSSL